MTRFFIVLSAILSIHSTTRSQFIANPPIPNGIIETNEYGSTLDGTNQQSTNGGTWYCTWDASHLYLAISGSNPSEGAVIYLDVNPTIPVNGGQQNLGSVGWNGDYSRNNFRLPIRADLAIYASDTYAEYRHSDGTGNWSSPSMVNLTVVGSTPNQVIEMAIPWNTVTSGNGRPPAFNWFGYKVFDNGDGENGTYDQVPLKNPIEPNNCGAGEVNTLYPTYYYSVVNTDHTTSTFPFAALSFTGHADFSEPFTGGHFLKGDVLYDLTVNDNSPDNYDNIPVNDAYDNQEIANRVLIDSIITISRNLVVWTGSALLPANNVLGNIDAEIIMDGSAGKIYNFGRIDCNPEVSFEGDFDGRRIDLSIDGTTRMMASPIDRSRNRYSNITVYNGSQLLGPSTGTAEMELQYGKMTVNGILDFNNAGSVNVSTREDCIIHNTYRLSSPNNAGTFVFNDFEIGRNSSDLKAEFFGGTVNLQIRGDFENYGRFIPTNNNGEIKVVMNGTGRQEIKGNASETFEATIQFKNLEIDNDNGLDNNNLNADVHFVSVGPGQVRCVITGDLSLSSGDLVTRNRVTGEVHNLILSSGGNASHSGGASDMAGNPSSYIDGPVHVKTTAANEVLTFPVGKDGAFRQVWVEVFDQSFQVDSFSVELFHSPAQELNNALPVGPEIIQEISGVHYWNVSSPIPFSHDSVKVTLSYSSEGSDDSVSLPDDLRILKAPSGGNGVWQNVSPWNGASAAIAGTHSTVGLTSLSDFTFGSVGNDPLPVELLYFEAEAQNQDAMLYWATAAELNNAYFRIEKSTDGFDWSTLTEVEGAGNSSQVLSYSYRDSEPSSGLTYYKLYQVDFDGTEKEYDVRTVYFASSEVNIYPNPVAESLHVVLPEGLRNVTYTIVNGLGIMVKQGVLAGEGVTPIDLHLDAGVYTIIFPELDAQTHRFVKR